MNKSIEINDWHNSPLAPQRKDVAASVAAVVVTAAVWGAAAAAVSWQW